MLNFPCHINFPIIHSKRNPHWNRNRCACVESLNSIDAQKNLPRISIFFCMASHLDILTSTGSRKLSLTFALKRGWKKAQRSIKIISYYILFQILNPTGVSHLCPLPNWKKPGSPQLQAIKVGNHVEGGRKWMPSVESQPAFRWLGAPNDANFSPHIVLLNKWITSL